MRKLATLTLAMTLFSVLGQAQTKVEVRKGDTLEKIAARNGITTRDLESANGISRSDKIKPGQKLVLPSKSKRAATTVSRSSSTNAKGGQYAVRNGDNDWSIAARFGITSKQLRLLNPGVTWTRLKIGQKLNVPGGNSQSVAAKSTQAKAIAVSKPAKGSTYAYRVKSGDNDWIIARRHDTTVANLKALNPTVNFANLKVGIYVRVPGKGPQPTTAAHTGAIRSRYGVIAKDGVIVRRGAGTHTEKVVIVPMGTEVTILDKQGEWYKLRFPRGTVGWVRGDMLKGRSAPAVVASNKTSKSTKTPRPTSVASRPTGSRSTVASYAKPNTSKTKTTSKPATRVASTRGSGSYVSNGDSHAAVNNALGMVGTRYRYGAMSRSATDCSGLVKQAYSKAGVNLPRTSSEMSKVGKPVSKGDLQAGDLVFFKTRGSRISHVGIYQGNGKFVHASSGKGQVTVSDINGGYYQRRYAGARRVTPSKSSSSSKSSTSSAKSTKAPVAAKPKVSAPIGESNPTKGTDEIAP